MPRKPPTTTPTESSWRPIGEGVRVVYEDEHLAVIDKPSGLNSVPPEGQDVPSVFGVVKEWAKRKAGARRERGERAAWIVHRLDKEVSGLMVFAKTQRAFEHLKEELRVKRVQREYVLVVTGSLREGDAHSVSGFVREGADGIMRHVAAEEAGDASSGDSAGDKHATTHLRVLRTGRTRSIVLATLDTGRKNQIRVHMQAIGRPICGDRRFGSTDDPVGRVCLHAMRLSFAHPVDGRTMQFESPMPGAFGVTLGGLREGERIEGTQRLVQMPPAKADGKGAEQSLDKCTDRASKAGSERVKERGQASAAQQGAPTSLASSWDHVAGWYDEYIERGPSDHHQQVIVPGTMRMLGVRKGMRVLDVACGQGVLCRALRERGVVTAGVDAAPGLIERARTMDPQGVYVVGDARELTLLGRGTGEAEQTTSEPATSPAIAKGARRGAGRASVQHLDGSYDAATCIMALMNIEPLGPVLSGVARWLKPGGVFVAVMLHPAFRSPGQTSWGWDSPEARTQRPATNSKAGKKAKYNDSRGGSGRGSEERVFAARDKAMREARSAAWESAVQFRRVDGYLSPAAKGIVMNPGAVAKGEEAVTTMTYHRPLQTYVRAFGEAGLLLDAMEEWPSVRMSEPGPRAAAENRARREIPMFVALRGVKVGGE
jgi:RluA family pseudouridine synthase